jgi:hypothetical protein
VTETTIPLLPCTSPESTVEFFDALGFYVERQQTRPYLYMTFRFGDFALHFKDAPRNLNPADELSGGCLVMVDAVDAYHRTFSAGLRRRYGRMPTSGLPRITRLRPDQTRFCLYDPTGNCIVFINRTEPDIEYGGSSSMSGLAKALDNVRILRDIKNDGALAARALDVALSRHRDAAPRVDVARGLADRVELAIALGDREAAEVHRDQLLSMGLSAAERAAIAVQLRAIDDLERWLSD